MPSGEELDLINTTCCIIPMYNEDQVIYDVVRGLNEIFPHILCVDDGSSDNSAKCASDAGAKIVRHSLNIGQGGALATGFSWVQKQSHFKQIITFDADGQHSPDDALRLLKLLQEKNLDVVFASRFLDSNQSHIPMKKRVLLRNVARLTRLLTDVQLSDAHNGLRALTSDASRTINISQNGMAHATQFVSLAHQANLTYDELPVKINYTDYSKSKGQSILNSVNIALDLIWG
jgi:glycosyltransferase involved in cell wall biosynthesis